MRKIILIAIITLNVNIVFAQTAISAGNVSGLWTLANSPYNINGDIAVPADSLLTIQAGVKIQFQGPYALKIFGKLLAVGLVTDSIVFTSIQDSIPLHGNGLRFYNNTSSDTSKIIYCKLEKEYAQTLAGDLHRNNGGAIYATNYTNLIISNNLITNNMANFVGGGIWCESSNPIIKNNTIINNSSEQGGGIYCANSNPIISDNIITNDTAGLGAGGAIYIEITLVSSTCDALILNNIVANNYAYTGGAGIECDSKALIIGNAITNNNGDGGSGAIDCTSSNPVLINNVICNNTTAYGGGAISCYYNSSPTFINNTISNNNSDEVGGSVFCSNSSSPTFINCILYGNITQMDYPHVHLYDSTCHPNFINCDIENGIYAIGDTSYVHYTGNFQNNIDVPPLYTSPTIGAGLSYNALLSDWSLQSASHCINSGITDTTGLGLPSSDYAGNIRVVGRIDIGAFEDQINTSINEKIVNNSFLLFPNPSKGQFNIVVSSPQKNTIIEIYNSIGELIYSQKIVNEQNTIELTNEANGLYFIKVMNDNKIIGTQKILKE